MRSAADHAEGHRQRALLRASRAALLWPEEAAAVADAGLPLTELRAIGPWLARHLESWMEKPPPIPDPPEIRADFLTFSQARSLLAEDASWRTDLRADLQMHTHASDGAESIENMAEACSALGYEYIAITDHSKGQRIPRGIDESEVALQGRRIDELNDAASSERTGVHILRALEMNISPDGSGDMDEACLEGLDLVLGSFHSQLRITEDQTDRYLATLENPYVHVIGHPRGRKYDRRLGLQADWPRVFATAHALDKAFEINAYPDRQDLQAGLLAQAREEGVRLTIGTDAHDTLELLFVEVALANALSARIPKDQILNFSPVEEVLAWTESHRAQRT